MRFWSANVWVCCVLFQSRISRSLKARAVPAYAAASSQLYSERASVVSMCLTTSFSNSSGLVKPLGVFGSVSNPCHSHATPAPPQPRRWPPEGADDDVQITKKRGKLTNFLQAALCGSGMLASTFLISPGPKPVTVLLCFGLVNWGPTGPWRSANGALIEGRLSRGVAAVAVAMSSVWNLVKRVFRRERAGEDRGAMEESRHGGAGLCLRARMTAG